MPDLFNIVSDTLTSSFQAPPDQVRPEAHLSDLLHDSLDRVEFTTVLGTRLEVTISDEELDQAETIADVVALVERKKVDH
ncbi:acyl carrier protein [Streptomyces sp. NPDC004435]|uniref:acyl carrier protein n=1 Tax=Streptomyces sp. NPDC004435 TaxID=3364701 RepID=UPI00368DEE22